MKRLVSIALCAILIFCLALAGAAGVKKSKVVRVGWYESAFHTTDQFGRRSGYGYEYQQRLAIYTGWTYEYVEGSWSELLEKLMAGEIDLLSDVSRTAERAEKILYSAQAMGYEDYHIFIAPGNTEILPDDFSTLNGKRVAVNKNSIQEQLFIDWAEEHQVQVQLIESSEKTPVLLEQLSGGVFDALVTLDTYANTADIIPVCRIGSAESYFGINKNRFDLKQELDMAMDRLFEDNRDFDQQLTEKFNRAGTINSFLSPEEKKWVAEHEVIRVGYRDHFLPYCGLDENTKQFTGALADFLAFAETSQKNASLKFEPQPFTTMDDALRALRAGEIDCVFPLSLSAYDGEQLGVITTDPMVRSEMFAIVRSSDHRGISRDAETTVAVIGGNWSYDAFVMDNFPNWKIVYCEDEEAVCRTVSEGGADCRLISNYRISRMGSTLNRYKLSLLTTDETMNVAFAVRREDDSLYSILNKVTRLYPDSELNSSLTAHAFREEKVSFIDFLRDNFVGFIAAAAVIAVIILLLILRSRRISERAEEGQRIISETERDALTGLYNWNYFIAYANRMHREHPEKRMDAVSVNIDRFHSINALHGRDYGDGILRELGGKIGEALQGTGGIASRYHGDRFLIYCPEGKDWAALLDEFQACVDRDFDKANVHLRMGIKPPQEGMEPELQLDKARTACGVARGDFMARAVVYDDRMEMQEEREQLLLNDLPRALENRELEVYYQPKFDIRPEKPVLSSAEALVRWNHPELGLIGPKDFIELFEKSGQITMIDNYVWEEAARQIAEWRGVYGFSLPVSVNLSRVDVFDPNLISNLDRIVESNGLSPRDLKLEVTESAYTENADHLIRVIETLRGKGYEIEMDDFGSGYSSLNMLSSLPVDVLKMDIAFIRNIERDEKDFRLVELIIDIARYLRVPVVAEGVETENQLKLLRDAGCDIVQGYYFSGPLPAEVFRHTILG